MVDEVTELPVTEEPKVETAKEEVKPKENTDELMGVLKTFGMEETKQLEGRLTAGSEAGRLAQLLGDQKNLTTQATNELAVKDAEIAKLMARSENQEYGYQENAPVDLAAEVRKGVRQELQEQQSVMRKVQEASLAKYSRITGHPQYKHVEEIWEQRKSDPVYINKVQSGMVDPEIDFFNDLLDFHGKVHQESHKTIEQLTGGVKTPVPHVESGETRSHTNIVSEEKGESANRKFLNAMQKKVDTGYLPTDEENALIAEAVLAESLEV